MKALLTVMLLLAGCGPVEAVVLPGPGREGDADADADADGDSDTDTDTDAQNDALDTWTGKREFSATACNESVDETGTDVTDDTDYADQVAACSTCDAVFRITVSPDTICTVIRMATPTFRGLEFNGQDVKLYWISNDNGTWVSEEKATGKVQNNNVFTYSYNDWGGQLSVNGQVTLSSSK